MIGLSKPFYGGLYVFKGPHYGSIHQIVGQDTFTFTLSQIAAGAPAVSHQGIVTTPTDVYWISQFGIHSLQTTVKYGNVETAFLSLPIQTLWRLNQISRTDLINAKGFWDPRRSIVGWLVTVAGATRRQLVLCYNYALSDPTPGGKKFWSIHKYTDWGLTAATPVVISSNLPSAQYSTGDIVKMFGSDQGLTYFGDYPRFQDDGAAFDAAITTPLISRFRTDGGVIPETQEKSFYGVVTYFVRQGATSTCTLRATVDGYIQARTFQMAAEGDVLGGPTDT